MALLAQYRAMRRASLEVTLHNSPSKRLGDGVGYPTVGLAEKVKLSYLNP
jgi:hypothetical protein